MTKILKSQAQSLFTGTKRLLAHLSLRRRWQLVGLLALMLLGAVAELASLGAVLPFLALLADPKVAFKYPMLQELFAMAGWGQSDDLLFPTTFLFAMVVVAAAVVRIFLSWSTFKFAFAVGHDISVEVYRRNLYQPYNFHVTHNSSEIIASIDKCNAVVFNVVLPLIQTLVSVILCIAILAALLRIDALSATVAGFGFAVIYLTITFFTRQTLRVNSQAIATTQTKRVQAVQEGLGGIRDVLIDNTQGHYVKRFRDLDLALRQAQISSSFISSTPRYVIESIGMVLIAGIAYWQTMHGGGLSASLPILGALALGAQKLMPQMQQIYYGWASYSGNLAQLEDVLRFLDRPIPPEYATPAPANALKFNREIRVHDVTFSYQAAGADLIKRLSLSIPKGARIGFVGATGSGKSTVIDLIMGLHTPMSGSVQVDGQSISASNRRAWQLRIAHVPQTIYLADATIAENIAFGEEAHAIDMERVRAAASKAQIADHIESMPNRYGTAVGERGVRLSGGQRQRIGIARALYKRSDVLVLDEATSALDDTTELAVMRSIAELGNSTTVLMIAHRLSTLKECDLIFELKNGKIVRYGRYGDLWPD
jgi:ABC-type multidrug transport system fused ATPase/permease subunit